MVLVLEMKALSFAVSSFLDLTEYLEVCQYGDKEVTRRSTHSSCHLHGQDHAWGL